MVCALAFVDLIVVARRCENRSSGETLTPPSVHETPPPAGRDFNGRRRKKEERAHAFQIKILLLFKHEYRDVSRWL